MPLSSSVLGFYLESYKVTPKSELLRGFGAFGSIGYRV